MPEPQYIVAIIMTALGFVAWFMITQKWRGWENKMIAQDGRLDKHDERHNQHDLNHAIVSTNLKNMKLTVEETHDDVKELLKSNGRRATK